MSAKTRKYAFYHSICRQIHKAMLFESIKIQRHGDFWNKIFFLTNKQRWLIRYWCLDVHRSTISAHHSREFLCLPIRLVHIQQYIVTQPPTLLIEHSQKKQVLNPHSKQTALIAIVYWLYLLMIVLMRWACTVML